MAVEKLTYPEFKNLRYSNFAMASERELMKSAIEKVRSELGGHYRLGDGQRVEGLVSNLHASYNPSKKTEVVGSVQLATKEEALAALEKLHAFAPQWRKMGVVKRAELLEALADWMEERRYELSAWMIFEVGKGWKEADADLAEAVDFCRYYAREALKLFTPKLTQKLQGETNTLHYQARGVAVVIAPWNFPLAILTGMTTAALVTGNPTILKPAEQSSVIAAFLAQGMKAVGFPEDSFYFLPADGEQVGPLLVQDERVDLIAFTGSAQVGLSIIETAAKKPGPRQKGVKKVIAEMGGKNALIVDEDADLDEAVSGAIHSAFGFQGQKCSALSRLLVHENVYENFVRRFIEATKSLQMGEAFDPDNAVGPVIDEEAQARILKTISEAEGRLECLYKAENIPSHGYYVPPSIFKVEDRNDPLFQNEVFGPVVAIKKVTSLDEAIEDTNSVRFALTGGIYSRSPSHIEKVKEELEVGNLYINRGITGAIVERQPFGGFKLSGVGSKAGGPDYLLQFVEPKTITENTVRRGFAGD